MADLGVMGGFNANDVPPNEGFDVLPAGEYDVIIVASELKKTSAGTGQYLKLEMQVLNGQYQNRKLWDQLNIVNPNGQAQQIARGTLSAICRAINVLTPRDSSELHNKPLRVKVAIKKDAEYGDKNEVKSYKPRNAAPSSAIVPPTSPSSAASSEVPVAAGAGDQPW